MRGEGREADLFASEGQQVRVLCDDGLGQAHLAKEGQLGIGLVGRHHTVHPSGPGSLGHGPQEIALDLIKIQRIIQSIRFTAHNVDV